MNDVLISDDIKDFSQGQFEIRDNIFHLKFPEREMITGFLSQEISDRYKYVYTDDFLATIGESVLFSKDVGESYSEYRLLNIIV